MKNLEIWNFLKGYEQNNSTDKACEDKNECTDNVFTCGNAENGNCRNYDGTHACYCNSGFQNRHELDSECLDIDECGMNEIDCGFNNICTNTIGSYQCECGAGYYHTYEWEPCQDIDECLTEVASFEPDFCQGGICSNYAGGYDCTCPSNSFLAYDNGPNRVSFCGMI